MYICTTGHLGSCSQHWSPEASEIKGIKEGLSICKAGLHKTTPCCPTHITSEYIHQVHLMQTSNRKSWWVISSVRLINSLDHNPWFLCWPLPMKTIFDHQLPLSQLPSRIPDTWGHTTSKTTEKQILLSHFVWFKFLKDGLAVIIGSFEAQNVPGGGVFRWC